MNLHIESSFCVACINGKQLIFGRPKELRHNDSIEILDSSLSAFTYFDCVENEQFKYPEELSAKYMILNSIGRGSFGHVKLAVSHDKIERRAVKILNKKVEGNAKYLESEENLLKSVQHSCIVKLYDVVKTDEFVYLVMDLASDGQLPQERLSERVRMS